MNNDPLSLILYAGGFYLLMLGLNLFLAMSRKYLQWLKLLFRRKR